jgi:hypothetical protein
MNERIVAALERVRQTHVEHVRVIAEVQLACTHTRCAEADYIPFEYGNSIRPIGVCLDCGMTEDGWAVYYGLTGLHGVYTDMPRIDRDKLYKMRVGLHLNEELKTQLLRREVSLCTLIADWLKTQGAV